MRPLHLSRLGLGTLQFPLLGQEAVNRLVARALDLGVTTFDTAVRYGAAEEMLGRALAWVGSAGPANAPAPVVCAKTHVRTGDGALADLERSLRLLGGGRVGVYMLHDLRWGADYETAVGPGGALSAIIRRKERGDVQAVGLSTHRPDTALRAATELPLQALMVPANVVDWPVFAPAVDEARRRGLAILGMKALAGGALLPAATALRAALRLVVDCLFVGVRSEAELEENAATAGATPETPDGSEAGSAAGASAAGGGQTELDEAVRALGPTFCRGCGYCLPCPEDIPIPEILRLWRYVTVYHSGDLGGFGYRRLARRADACSGCGICEERCSYGLPVRELLKAAHFDLTMGVAMGKGQ